MSVNGTINDGGFIQDYPSGVMRFTEFDAFCVDPTEDISFGESLVYQVQDISLLTNFSTVARLVGGYLSSGQTAQDAAAVQWAIWETTTEFPLNTPSLLDGNVRITAASQPTADLANQYLANVGNFAPADLVYLTNNGRQDVVTWNIPEPGSLVLTAFSAVLLLRRRR
jgi:hypothetical protein